MIIAGTTGYTILPALTGLFMVLFGEIALFWSNFILSIILCILYSNFIK